MQQLGRWQQLLIDALAEHETVGVQAVLEGHLDRGPTRAERNAAQRAAHLLTRRGRATISYLTAPAGVSRSRLAVTRPPDWPRDWLNQNGGSSQKEVVRWQEPAAFGAGAQARFGRWQQVIMEALDRYDGVGLRAVVEGHLGRRGERAESTAAQRAARLLAGSGQVRLAHVRVPSTNGRRSAELLLVAKADVDPAELTPQAVQAAAVRRVTAADRTRDALELIVTSIQDAAAEVPEIDLHTVDGDAAARAAQALAVPLVRLSQLRQSLLMRRPRR